jgi:hypothetical protein
MVNRLGVSASVSSRGIGVRSLRRSSAYWFSLQSSVRDPVVDSLRQAPRRAQQPGRNKASAVLDGGGLHACLGLVLLFFGGMVISGAAIYNDNQCRHGPAEQSRRTHTRHRGLRRSNFRELGIRVSPDGHPMLTAFPPTSGDLHHLIVLARWLAARRHCLFGSTAWLFASTSAMSMVCHTRLRDGDGVTRQLVGHR